jgi:hypothetical protein
METDAGCPVNKDTMRACLGETPVRREIAVRLTTLVRVLTKRA